MKILKNCSVTKLKEYSRSYGNPETVSFAYIFEHDKIIICLDEIGRNIRTFNKGTKVLISYKGTEISERSFKIATNKAVKAHEERKAQDKLIQEAQMAKESEINALQLAKWEDFLKSNTEKLNQYAEIVRTRPSNASRSGNWRRILKLKFAKNCNSESFENCPSPAQLNETIFKLINQTA